MSLASLPHSTHIWALVDCDSFFAGCEVARNPALRGQCVCICRQEDIVLASTYEAKARGVKTGTPAREAKRILGKDAVFIRPDMVYYQHVSAQIMQLLSQEANEIEVFSIDEAFIDITHHMPADGAWYRQRAEQLQAMIMERLGISVSIGVAPTRLLAKMFAGMHKPYGITIGMSIEEIHARIRHLPITEIPFISRKRAMRLQRCQTIGDFLDADDMYIKEIMGGSGLKLYRELHGINAVSLKRKEKQKAIERTRSFHPHFTSDKELLRVHLMHNFERAYRELIACQGSVRTLRVSMRGKNFRRHIQLHRFPWYTTSRETLLAKTKELFEKIYSPHELRRTTGITLSEISYNAQEAGLFDNVRPDKKIYETIDKLNEKFGGIVVTSATTHRTLQKGEDPLMKIRG